MRRGGDFQESIPRRSTTSCAAPCRTRAAGIKLLAEYYLRNGGAERAVLGAVLLLLAGCPAGATTRTARASFARQ